MKKTEEATPKYLLRNMRESQGWTQEELAEKIGTTGVTISRWESGITFPSPYFRAKLSALYGKSISELGLLQEELNDQGREELEVTATYPIESTRTDMGSSVSPGPVFLFNEPLPGPEEVYGRKSEREIMINRTSHKA